MFDDAISLLTHLEETHDADVHLYRGQTRRFVHDWDYGDGAVHLESLYPADYRFIVKYDNVSQILFQDIHAARAYGRDQRDLFAQAMTLRALSDPSAHAWLAEDISEYISHLMKLARATDGEKRLIDVARDSEEDISNFSTSLFQLFWSLAQHYLIATALTDVTFSPGVAAWFATHPWEPSDPAPTEGSGVIYRFRRPCLEEVLERESGVLAARARREGEPRPPDLFFVDIRRIPAEFARRPSGQQGGSIYGFDQPRVLRAVFESGCVDIFEFHHGKKAASLGGLRKVTVPEDDPFAALASRIRSALDSRKTQLIALDSETTAPASPEAAEYLQRLVLTAKLAIDKARFNQRVPLENKYAGYHYVDIESHGSHGYTHLLAIVNEQTRGVLGYVSSEPLGGLAAEFPVKPFVLAVWFNGIRAVAGVGARLDSSERFIEQAVSLANEALDSVERAAPRSALGLFCNYFGGAKQAEESLEKAWRLGDIDAAVNLGQLYAEMSRFDEAEAIWREAIENGSADAAHNLATMYFGLQQFDRAEESYFKALDLGDSEASYNMGTLFEAKSDWGQAEHYYRQALGEFGDQRAPNNLGVALLRQGRPSEAEDFFRLGHAMGDEIAGENLKLLLREKG